MGAEEEEVHLKRKIRAWSGWNVDKECGSREYRSSKTSGTPRDFNSSLWGFHLDQWAEEDLGGSIREYSGVC